MASVNELGVFITRPAIGSRWTRDGKTYQVAATHGHFVIMEGCRRISASFLVNNFEEVKP